MAGWERELAGKVLSTGEEMERAKADRQMARVKDTEEAMGYSFLRHFETLFNIFQVHFVLAKFD